MRAFLLERLSASRRAVQILLLASAIGATIVASAQQAAQTDRLAQEIDSSPEPGKSHPHEWRLVAEPFDLDGDAVEDEVHREVRLHPTELVAGRIVLMSGWDGEALDAFVSRRGGDAFGWDVVCLGDLDGDSMPDLAVAAPRHGAAPGALSAQRGPWGAVHVLSGASGRVLASAFGEREGMFGTGLVVIEDRDGDDAPDLLVRESLTAQSPLDPGSTISRNEYAQAWTVLSSRTGARLDAGAGPPDRDLVDDPVALARFWSQTTVGGRHQVLRGAPGDVTGDGRVTDEDRRLLLAAVGDPEGHADPRALFDLSGDGRIDGRDLALARRDDRDDPVSPIDDETAREQEEDGGIVGSFACGDCEVDCFPNDPNCELDPDGGPGPPPPPPDADNDGIPDSTDNCPNTPNPDQRDCDGDGVGDACDPTPGPDTDGDGILDCDDNCPDTPNAEQRDCDGDGIGDACDPSPGPDTDGDGVNDCDDNCPGAANPDQADCDGDGVGDACESIQVGKVIEVRYVGGNEIWTDPDGATAAEIVLPPQYLDGDGDGVPEKTLPLAYTREGMGANDEIAVVQIKIAVDGGCAEAALPALSVEGRLSDAVTGLDLTFTGQGTVTNGVLTVMNLTTEGTLPTTVQAYLNETVTWAVIHDGVEHPAGTSTNSVYVTLGDADLDDRIEDKEMETLYYIGCVQGAGAADMQTLFDSMWPHFQTLAVTRRDGAPLSYYNGVACPFECPTGVENLVATGNAQCSGFTDLLVGAMQVHGAAPPLPGAPEVWQIEADPNTLPNDPSLEPDHFFLIANYIFLEPGSSGLASYPLRASHRCIGVNT